MTSAELQAIEDRAAKATPGPWCDESDNAVVYSMADGAGTVAIPFAGYGHHLANSEFIAHAREDVPALCAEVRRLRAALEAVAHGSSLDGCRMCGFISDRHGHAKGCEVGEALR